MFDREHWGVGFGSMEQVHEHITRVQIWALWMRLATAHLCLYDGADRAKVLPPVSSLYTLALTCWKDWCKTYGPEWETEDLRAPIASDKLKLPSMVSHPPAVPEPPKVPQLLYPVTPGYGTGPSSSSESGERHCLCNSDIEEFVTDDDCF
ncbi:hypothetical protein FRC06_008573 [Ceratobasidium sp. 370]|nr:hypothetical protein FRC06_008573 [Ceratobasidium sp. 370]